MRVWTDSLSFANRVGVVGDRWETAVPGRVDRFAGNVLEKLGLTGRVFVREVDWSGAWEHLFLVARAPRSQFDAVAEALQEGGVSRAPFLCAAETGSGFHGFKGRPWVGLPGNLHLVACMHPERRVQQPGVGPIVLSTVAILETIDDLPGLKGEARVKWVNDILMRGAKVGGIIARSQSMGHRIQSVLLGIGVNVEQTPEIVRDPFVPRAAALTDFMPGGGALALGDVLPRLVTRLGSCYSRYLDGAYQELLEVYRRRSAIVGRLVRVLEDTAKGPSRELRRGRVVDIGEGLELYLDDGASPVVTGRLVLE